VLGGRHLRCHGEAQREAATRMRLCCVQTPVLDVPLCTSAGEPTAGRIQITASFVSAKAKSKHRLPGESHTRLQTLL